jgi:hypothetical protein
MMINVLMTGTRLKREFAAAECPIQMTIMTVICPAMITVLISEMTRQIRTGTG